MALIVEDGTIVANADSYCSVAFADAYLAGEVGHDGWAELSTIEKERGLRTSTRLIDLSGPFAGAKVEEDQPLAWPREEASTGDRALGGAEYVFDADEIPTRLKQAVATFAAILCESPNYLRDLEDARTASVSTTAGTKSWRGQRQVDMLPASVRLLLRGIVRGSEIPYRRVA